MAYDMVHVHQQLFRKVVDAMARPGRIMRLNDEVAKMDISIQGCFPTTVLLARLLLDTEVTFHLAANEPNEMIRRLNHLTYANHADIKVADYIFATHTFPQTPLLELIKQAKIGNLRDPQDSATLVLEVDHISEAGNYRLTGPGIKTEALINLSLDEAWLAIRNEKNREFPMGIDIIIVDKNHQLLCLPRTTKIEQIGR